jgi:hypothetical protein
MRRSGGHIFVSSEVGIYLPQVQSETEANVAEPIADTREFERSGTELIAEDQESLRDLISETMRAEGYEILEAANGEEAWA